jgi:hypothetical protein
MKVGAESNKITNAKKPNIFITFGWKKLKGNTECLRSLDGLMIKSSIDLTEDGQTMISLEYIETVTSVTGTIRYLDPNDIEIIYRKKESDSPKMNNMLVSEKLTWLTDWNASGPISRTTVAKILMDNKIKYIFEPTNDDKDVDVDVGFGDYLIDVINELTAKARHEKIKDQNFSYERGVMWTGKYNGVEDVTFIPYVWKAAPDENNPYPEKLLGKLKEGPVLSYKKSAAKGEKQLLSFTSDLNSKTSLMMQSQDELNKKLLSFSEDDMEMLNKTFREKGVEGLNEKERSPFAWGDKRDQMDRRNRVRVEMKEVLQGLNADSSANQNSQLKAILANNVFKGTVKIMGDPTIGTDFEPWAFKMKTNFDSIGGFGKVFGQRTWALTYVKHFFKEGSFETEMEILAYPEPPDTIIPPYRSVYDIIKTQEK